MSPRRGVGVQAAGSCAACRRRSWLLGELSALLDYHRGDPARLAALLELADEELIEALAGRRRGELRRAWLELPVGTVTGVAGGGDLCRHDPGWPERLGEFGAASMLWLAAPRRRLEDLLRAPTVAVLGTREPSPYGAAMAGGLARGLAAAGVTVIAGLTGELAAAAHHGVLEARAGSLAVAGDGLARIRPAAAGRIARQLAGRGCVVSALPASAGGRGWGVAAALRTIVAMADLAIVLEAGPEELVDVGASAVPENRLGAVPGPLTSRLSGGPHALIRAGARLIRDPGDALEALYAERQDDQPPPAGGPAASGLEPQLRAVLERVGAGEDTAERLGRGAADAGAVMAALGELEALGLLQRLPGGRYLPRHWTRAGPIDR